MTEILECAPARSRNVAALKAAWGELRLKIMRPAALEDISEDQWAALAESGSNHAFLRRELPIIIASFREAATESMMQWARRQNRKLDIKLLNNAILLNEPGIGYAPEEFVRDYWEDINSINRALFGSEIKRARVTGGRFKEPIAPPLHMDQLQENGVHYIARIGALPFEMIAGRAVLSMPAPMYATLMAARARNNSPPTLEAMHILRRNGILKSFPLGAVVMMFGPKKRPDPSAPSFAPEDGTLHCSTPLPPEGAFSMLFRSAAYLG